MFARRGKMAVESRVTQEEIKKEPEKPIDREKVPGAVQRGLLRRSRPRRGGNRGGGSKGVAAP